MTESNNLVNGFKTFLSDRTFLLSEHPEIVGELRSIYGEDAVQEIDGVPHVDATVMADLAVMMNAPDGEAKLAPTAADRVVEDGILVFKPRNAGSAGI